MSATSSLKIAQSEHYRGKDWWDWSVWLEGPDDALDSVKEVRWRLHPTFTPSSVRTDNRADQFRLDTSGWGTFELAAQIVLRNGSEIVLKHELELSYPEKESEEPPPRSSAS